MKKTLGWFKEREGRIIVIFLFVLVISFIPCILPIGTLKAKLIIAGTILQISGITASFYALYTKNKKYSLNNKISFKRWLSRCPLLNKGETRKNLSANISQQFEMTGEIDSFEEVKPENDTISAKVEALEKTIKLQNQRIFDIRKQISSKMRQLDNALEKTKEETQQNIKEIDKITKTMVFGDIHLQYIGLFWMFMGLTLFLFQSFLP